MAWQATWRGGPVKRFTELREATAYVERCTPLKRGWTTEWVRRTAATRFYDVRNGRGRLVHSVIVQRVPRGRA